jgi:hypothetical protein
VKRQQQVAAAAKAQAELMLAKQLAAAERKRQAEEQVTYADNWRALVAHFGEPELSMLANVKQLLCDAQAWRAHELGDGDECARKKVKTEGNATI